MANTGPRINFDPSVEMGDNSTDDELDNGDELLEPLVLATYITTLCASDVGVDAQSSPVVLVPLEAEDMDDDGMHICSSVSMVVSLTAAERAVKVSLHSHSATYLPAPARACRRQLAVTVKLPNDATQP